MGAGAAAEASDMAAKVAECVAAKSLKSAKIRRQGDRDFGD